jgi:hypothetical protein
LFVLKVGPTRQNPQMDSFVAITENLARPLVLKNGRQLLQLWRVDFRALARLSLVCRGAGDAVRLLWASTPLRARELARRALVSKARAFLHHPEISPFLTSTDWRKDLLYQRKASIARVRVAVAYNGIIRLKEQVFPGRKYLEKHGRWSGGPWDTFAGLKLTSAAQGHVLAIFKPDWRLPNTAATFTDREGALGSLRFCTYLGRERWAQTHPSEHKAWAKYLYSQPNLRYWPAFSPRQP